MGWGENVMAIRDALRYDKPYHERKWLVFADEDEIRIRWHKNPRWHNPIVIKRARLARLRPEKAVALVETEIAIKSIQAASESDG